MQFGFQFDQTRCIGCQTCGIACRDWHDLQDVTVSWLRVETIEKGKYPDLFATFLPFSCGHCAEPACADACPVGAISKREADGVMVVNADQCLGEKDCGLCREACPYQVPQFGAGENTKMQMCTLCPDRLIEGKKPICVDACPVYALDFGPLNELKAKHGDHREATGFVYSDKTKPSINFKPKVLK